MDFLVPVLGLAAVAGAGILGLAAALGDKGPAAVRLVRHPNVCWLEMHCPLRLSFELGSVRPREGSWKVSDLGGIPIQAERDDINRRFQTSEVLRTFVKEVFSFPGVSVKHIRVAPESVIVKLGYVMPRDELARKRVQALREYLDQTMPAVFRDLRNLPATTYDNRKR